MSSGEEMTTLSGVLATLKERGQDTEFRMHGNAFTLDDKKLYQPSDLKIVRTFRFEGYSDPDDSSILYLIETSDGKTAYALDAYGVYSNVESEKHNTFIRQIPVDHRDEQEIFS